MAAALKTAMAPRRYSGQGHRKAPLYFGEMARSDWLATGLRSIQEQGRVGTARAPYSVRHIYIHSVEMSYDCDPSESHGFGSVSLSPSPSSSAVSLPLHTLQEIEKARAHRRRRQSKSTKAFFSADELFRSVGILQGQQHLRADEWPLLGWFTGGDVLLTTGALLESSLESARKLLIERALKGDLNQRDDGDDVHRRKDITGDEALPNEASFLHTEWPVFGHGEVSSLTTLLECSPLVPSAFSQWQNGSDPFDQNFESSSPAEAPCRPCPQVSPSVEPSKRDQGAAAAFVELAESAAHDVRSSGERDYAAIESLERIFASEPKIGTPQCEWPRKASNKEAELTDSSPMAAGPRCPWPRRTVPPAHRHQNS